MLNRLRDKAADAMIDKAFNKEKNTSEQNSSSNSSPNENTTSNVHNTKGKGPSSSYTDAVAMIENANSSFDAKKYGDVRHFIRQAMLGVEIKIGTEVLKSFPETVNGLNAQKDQDQVTATGVGFAGLTIQRNYQNGDQRIEAIVANNSIWI